MLAQLQRDVDINSWGSRGLQQFFNAAVPSGYCNIIIR